MAGRARFRRLGLIIGWLAHGDEVNHYIWRIESQEELTSDEVLQKLRKRRLLLKDDLQPCSPKSILSKNERSSIADQKVVVGLQVWGQPMAIYIIAYDLHPSKGENYDKLFTALETIGSGYWDCLDSTWLVITEKMPVQIKDELKQYLKDDDRLLVMRYGEGASWLGFKDECRTWLEDKL